MPVLYSREFIKVVRQSKVCPRVTSLADCQVDSEKEWGTESARGENRTHLNFIFACKFSIGFYAVRLVWKRKLSHRNRNRRRSTRRNRNMQVNGPLLAASVWAFGHLCTRFALTLAWHKLNPHLNRMRMRCPLQLFPLFPPLLPCHAFGYETIETSLQSVHKVFTRTQNSETEAETNRRKAGETDGQTGGHWDGQQTQQKIQKLRANCAAALAAPVDCRAAAWSGCLTVNKSRRA